MKPRLLIVLEGKNGRALAVARVSDPALLETAARSAILEKQREASEIEAQDQALGLAVREEALRLERTLDGLIPGVSTAGALKILM
jgi:hypothetical protein